MPVPMDVRKKIEEDLRLIESGKQSYGSLAERYGLSKSTVFRMHIKKLKRLVEKAKEELKTLKQEKQKLQGDFEGLEEGYQRKNSQLNKRHEEKKERLEGEIRKLRQERKGVKEAFENLGLDWDEGIRILKEVSDLRFERVKVQKELEGYRQLIENKKRELDETERTVKRLRAVERKEQQTVKKLSEQHSAYLSWLQLEAPILEERRRELKAEVDGLESTKKRLEKEFKAFLGIE